jgi:hypothetical protein
MKYTVYVDDNFHYQDEGERYELGEFATFEEAAAAARKIVDEFLGQACKPGMTARQLYENYMRFGEDPFIIPNDPAGAFSAWDYARQRSAELAGPFEKEESPMSEDAAIQPLRRELEAAYHAHVKALEGKDAAAFLDAVYGSEGKAETFRSRFGEIAESLLEMTPRLETSTFVAIRTEGEDLAGYYFIHRDPSFVNVCLTRFVKAEGRWKIVPESCSASFEPEEGEDVVARARELIETEEGLRLERPARPGDAPPSAPPFSWNESVQAILDCMAYGYEIQIAINGAMMPFTGGRSYSGRLFGLAEGAEPLQPAVLLAGDNQFDLTYRRTGDLDATLSLTIRGPSGAPVLQFGPIRGESGRLNAAFKL